MSGFEIPETPSGFGDEDLPDDFPVPAPPGYPPEEEPQGFSRPYDSPDMEMPPEYLGYSEFGDVTAFCGAISPGGLICRSASDHPEGEHSWSFYEPQPAPVHNEAPSMHDMVIRDLLSRDPTWDLSYGAGRHIRDQVCQELVTRKEFGLAKYGTILQPGNGRDFLLDVAQELMDASVYARGRMLEVDESSLEWMVLAEIYDNIVTDLVKLRRIRNAADNVAASVLPAFHRGGIIDVHSDLPIAEHKKG